MLRIKLFVLLDTFVFNNNPTLPSFKEYSLVLQVGALEMLVKDIKFSGNNMTGLSLSAQVVQEKKFTITVVKLVGQMNHCHA